MRRTIAAALLAASASAASAAPPELAAYVTDDNRDVYVALYDDVAVELAGCASEASAAALVGLAPGAVTATTLAELQATRDLAHPKIPCGSEARFDADFPATTPIWFDADVTKRYYLASPTAAGTFYSIPIACDPIKDAFAIRQRLALPGVLQSAATPPPDGMAREIVLDCGDGASNPDNPDDDPAQAAGDHWSLHRTDVFLSENSIGDPIYVAVFNRVTDAGVEKSYLPIYRINGAPAGEAVWEGSQSSERVETALAELFDIDPAQPVTTLGFEDVARLGPAVHLDLCLTQCEAYQHQHGFFPEPGQTFDLAVLPAPVATRHIGLLGEGIDRWEFAPGRGVDLVGCGSLAAAIGLAQQTASEPMDWGAAMEQAAGASARTRFTCSRRSEVCVRPIAEGGMLAQAHFNRGPDCPQAKRLRIELPAETVIASRITIDGSAFSSVEIAPADPLGRSRVKLALPQADPAVTTCLVDPIPAVLTASGGSRLTLARLDFVRSAEASAQEQVWLAVDNASAALDRVAVGATGEGLRPMERGVRLCHADLYIVGGSYQASLLGLHGLKSRLSIASPGDAEPVALTSGKFGVYLMAGSIARLTKAAVDAPRALTLNDSELRGARVALSASPGAPSSSGLRLERGARAELSISSARGFSCVATFTDPSASARFTLPVNALAFDNIRLNCGFGVVDVME